MIQLVMSSFILFLISIVILWALDPIICFFDNTKVNLDDSANWQVFDKYSEEHLEPPKRDSIDISLIFPAYNEEARLPITLTKALAFLKTWSLKRKLSYEIIVVDDGSKDRTVQVAKEWYKDHRDIFRIVSLRRNQGKGGAVKVGVSQAIGRTILMVDADGATEIEDLDRLYGSLLEMGDGKSPPRQGIVIGSRAHLAEQSMASRQLYRTILMKGFHFLVMILCTRQIQDTQCGFKLFAADSARTVFANLHLYRWAFDIEVLYQAEALQVPMKEMSVNWREIEGSKLIQRKLDIITTSLTMARDMFCVRLAYVLGIWSLPEKLKKQSVESKKTL